MSKLIYWYNKNKGDLSLITFLAVNKYKVEFIDAVTLRDVHSLVFFNARYQNKCVIFVEHEQDLKFIDMTQAACYLVPSTKNSSLSELLSEYISIYVETISEMLGIYFNVTQFKFISVTDLNFYQVLSSPYAFVHEKIKLWLQCSEPDLEAALALNTYAIAKKKKYKRLLL